MRKMLYINETTAKVIVYDPDTKTVWSCMQTIENGKHKYAGMMVDNFAPENREHGTEGEWLVTVYNELDADFGYDCGPSVKYTDISKSVAKSIERHLNRLSPDFIWYSAENGNTYYENRIPSCYR